MATTHTRDSYGFSGPVTAGGIAPTSNPEAGLQPTITFGSGAPTIAAPKGSLYLRTDGSGTGDRVYINTNGSTTWTAITTTA